MRPVAPGRVVAGDVLGVGHHHPLGGEPEVDRCSSWNDRSSRPAAASRTTDSATSATTSAARSAGRPPAVPTRSALLQRLGQVEPRGVDRRHQAEEQRARRGRARARTGAPSVDAHLAEAGQVGGRQRHQPLHEQGRERQAEAPGRSAEDGALGQQLPYDTAPAGSERGAQRDLARARRGAGEQQVRDVGARDEQHDAHGAHQAPTASVRTLPVNRSCSGIEGYGLEAVLRMLSRQAVADGPHLGPGPRERPPRPGACRRRGSDAALRFVPLVPSGAQRSVASG